MRLTPARLLRLFPGLWRLRYGAEFLALLESTPMTRTVVIDVVRSAAQEWLTRTRIGRVLIGLAVAIAAGFCAFAIARMMPPPAIPAQRLSVSSLSLLMLAQFATLLVGSLLIFMKTRRDRRYDWLGLRHQVVALFVSAVSEGWTLLRYFPDTGLSFGSWLTVTLMLVLLLNVERRREGFWPWPPPWWMRISSDRY